VCTEAVSDPQPDLDAGDFGAWLSAMREALRGERAADVPCGGCTACCTAGQFVHIGPDEVDTLAHIPRALLFPAPRLPPGHVVLGYDERGHCPMLRDGGCSIYDHRPRACRTYDCRAFTAAGITPDEPAKAGVAARVARWRFSYRSTADERLQEAVRDAAVYLAEHSEVLPDPTVARDATQRAVLAVEVHAAFVGRAAPDADAVRVEITRRARSARDG
jgi:Fe-S-cluster containining protein